MARLTRSLADLPEVAGLERWLSAHVIGRLPGAGEPAAPADAARGSAEGRTVETAQHEVVLLSQLLGSPVHDASGRPVGMVHDLRLRATDPSADLPFGVAHSLVVDGAGWRTRLSHAWGYAAEPRSGPAVLRWLLAPAACRARAVPVSQVHSWTRPVVVSGPLEGYPTLGEQEES